jgi:hypothetical protein
LTAINAKPQLPPRPARAVPFVFGTASIAYRINNGKDYDRNLSRSP